MRKKETRYRKFLWRVVERRKITNDGVYKYSTYVVERKTIFFGIPLWWSHEWQQNICDMVNINIRHFNNYDGALKQLEKEKNICSYGNRLKVVSVPVNQRRLQ